MAPRTAAARPVLPPRSPHSPPDARSDRRGSVLPCLRLPTARSALRISGPPRVTGSVSHVSDRASRRSGPAGKALTMLLFGAAGAATRSRGVALNGPQGDGELF